MADYSAISLEVHHLHKHLYEDLTSLLNWDEYEFMEDDKFGIFQTYEARWGANELDETVIPFLRRHNLPYRVTDFGHYTWTGQIDLWLPGWENPLSVFCTTEGMPLFDPAMVRLSNFPELVETFTTPVEDLLRTQARGYVNRT